MAQQGKVLHINKFEHFFEVGNSLGRAAEVIEWFDHYSLHINFQGIAGTFYCIVDYMGGAVCWQDLGVVLF